jgi:hypothetical protein
MTCADLSWLVPATVLGLLVTAAGLLVAAAWIIHRRAAEPMATVFDNRME